MPRLHSSKLGLEAKLNDSLSNTALYSFIQEKRKRGGLSSLRSREYLNLASISVGVVVIASSG